MPTELQRQQAYQAIFRGIPESFLDPGEPENKVILGGVAQGLAHARAFSEQFVAGLFLDSASSQDGDGATDGVSSLTRWGLWLQLTQAPGESDDDFRNRIRARLFSERTTRRAIIRAVAQLMDVPVTITNPGDRVVRFDEPPAGRKWAGEFFGYGSFTIETLGTPQGGVTGTHPGLAPLVNDLRAEGDHWRHRGVVQVPGHFDHGIGEPRFASRQRARQEAPARRQGWWRPDRPPNVPLMPLDGPRSASRTVVAQARPIFRAPSYSTGDLLGAFTGQQQGLPTLNWDDSFTAWEHASWGD